MTKEWNPNPAPSDPVLFDNRGHRRTASLFLEASQDPHNPPVFTMRDVERNGLPSAYELYMESADEDDAARTMVGTPRHWAKLLKCKWFMEGDPEQGYVGLVEWRKDMAARDASNAKKTLLTESNNGNIAAAKALLQMADKKQPEPKTASKAKRRGVQKPPSTVIDFDAAARELQE